MSYIIDHRLHRMKDGDDGGGSQEVKEGWNRVVADDNKSRRNCRVNVC